MKSSADWARELGIPLAAVELYRESDVIDLHVDSFIWQRTLGYDLTKRHRAPLWGAFLGQVDFPRIREAEISGATWVITTNPVREPADRARAFETNLDAALPHVRARADAVSGGHQRARIRRGARRRQARGVSGHPRRQRARSQLGRDGAAVRRPRAAHHARALVELAHRLDELSDAAHATRA